MKDIKAAFQSLGKFWFLSPGVLLDIYQEATVENKERVATTSLGVYKQFYK